METLGYRVAITRNYGSVSVTLELSSLTGGDTASERDAEFDRLTKELERQHKRISDSSAIKHASVQEQEQGQAQRGSSHTITFPITSVEMVYWKNKPCAKLKGGEYQKHGVICYPEVWDNLDFNNWYTLNPDDDLSSWFAVVEMTAAGAPRKVIGVTRNGGRRP